MSRNGSGTYTLPAGNPVVTGTTISSTWANNTLNDIAAAITDSLAADGQTTATGNLKMGGNRITGLADGIASTDAATKSQVDAVTTGLGTMSTQNANAVAITGGSITGITDLAVADGGTGRSTLTANAVLVGNGTSGINSVAPSTSGNVLTSDGTSWTSAAGAYPLTSGTAVSSTSGTSIDFTSIPTWVKRITINLSAVSTNGTSIPQIQIGAGSVETTGYLSGSSFVTTAAGVNATTATSGFIIFSNFAPASLQGSIILSLLGSNIWVAQGVIFQATSTANVVQTAGTKTLSGTLDRVRITTVNGTDTFDAGTINILYE